MTRRDSHWRDIAEAVIAGVDDRLPALASLDERRAALRAAYPFGERRGWPYKVWLRCQRAYLATCDQQPLTPREHPLFFRDASQQKETGNDI